MSNPEFEHKQPFTTEVDWSSEVKDFSAPTREVLQSLGFETFWLNGQYLEDLLDKKTSEKLLAVYGRFGFDFTNLRTKQSEVAVDRSLFLPNDNGETWQEENLQLFHYERELRSIDNLRSVSVCRGNLADYVAIYSWFLKQKQHLSGLPYFARSLTTDTFYRGNKSLAIKLLDKTVNNEAFQFRNIQMYKDDDDIRLIPIIIPT